MIEVGQKAPNFTLYDTDKKPVSLDSYKGKKVVLLFFPMAFTSVCTTELCSVRDDIARYDNLNTAVLGISVDSVFTLAKFKEDQQLNFPLLSDFNKEVSTNYGALYETFAFDMKGVSKRAAFVINEDGIVQHEEVLENAGNVPDFPAIQTALSAIV